MNATTQQLAQAALTIAVMGAKHFIKVNGWPAPDPDALIGAVRNAVDARITQSLADVKAAFEANMPEAAVMTFKADMVLAGIDAARTFPA